MTNKSSHFIDSELMDTRQEWTDGYFDEKL